MKWPLREAGGSLQDFHQLDVWKRAHKLVLRVYAVSKDLPASEHLGLVPHLRRAAVTIPRAIAEGGGRASDAEVAVGLKKARAARHELDYIVLLCKELGFLTEQTHDHLATEIVEVRKMISGLLKRLVGHVETLR